MNLCSRSVLAPLSSVFLLLASACGPGAGEPSGTTTTSSSSVGGASGWPVPVQGGHLFVSTDTTLSFCAGDHDGWAGTAMKADMGFDWVVITVPVGEHYKLTDKTTFLAASPARSACSAPRSAA